MHTPPNDLRSSSSSSCGRGRAEREQGRADDRGDAGSVERQAAGGEVGDGRFGLVDVFFCEPGQVPLQRTTRKGKQLSAHSLEASVCKTVMHQTSAQLDQIHPSLDTLRLGPVGQERLQLLREGDEQLSEPVFERRWRVEGVFVLPARAKK